MSSSTSSSSSSSRERALIEDLSLALVREYLAKKKYRTTLETLQAELPVKPVPTTTTALAKNLGITKFVSKNAKAEQPYATLLEIFAEFMYNKYGKEEGAGDNNSTSSSASTSGSSTTSSSSKPSTLDRQSSKIPASSLANSKYRNDEDEEQMSKATAKMSLNRPNSLMSSPATRTSGTSSNANKPLSPNSPSSYSQPITNSSSSSSRNQDRDYDRDRDRDRDRDSSYRSSSDRSSSDRDRGASKSSSNGGESSSNNSSSVIGSLNFGAARPSSASRSGRPDSNNTSTSKSFTSSSSNYSSSASNSKSRAGADDMMEEEIVDIESDDDDDHNSRSSKPSSSTNFQKPSASSLSAPTQPVPAGVPMSVETAHKCKSMIFGSSHLTGTFTDPWLTQGFFFKGKDVTSKVPSLSFGLVQSQGGPCGMLAVVQAYIVKELLFAPPNDRASAQKRYDLLSAPADVLKKALIDAWAQILWNISGTDQRRVICCLKNPSAPAMNAARKMSNGIVFKPDGISEALMTVELNSLDAVKNFFAVNYAAYTAPKGFGCVLFLYSILFSRGVENVEKDRDENSGLIGAHSYCTQEMVNLALTGRARSNVFNGTKDFDGLILRGIEKRSTIGFLSLFEHYENIEVGSYLKEPQFPIWVICSESHYTVGFALDDKLISNAVPSGYGGVFDLFYYDELANQKEEIKLTVDVSRSDLPKKDDLEPPINECVRTKWGKNARIDWNGVEPIL